MLNIFEDGDDSDSVRYTSRGRSSIGLRTVDIYVVTVLTLQIYGKSTRHKKNISMSELRWKKPGLHIYIIDDGL